MRSGLQLGLGQDLGVGVARSCTQLKHKTRKQEQQPPALCHLLHSFGDNIGALDRTYDAAHSDCGRETALHPVELHSSNSLFTELWHTNIVPLFTLSPYSQRSTHVSEQ